MTTPADDAAVEEAFEAYLAGRPVPAEAADLAAFAGAVRMSATEPGRPNAALAELLATGLLVDQPASSVRTTKRRRRPMWFFSVIIAKIASAGAVAQAATGAGIVLVGFTGVGAVGALPAPVQHTFATVVASITPLTAPDGADDTATDPSTDPGDPTVVTTPAAPTSESAQPTDATDGEVAGAPAAETPTAPENHGQVVSSLAHERNAERKAEHKNGSDAASSTGAHETEATDSEDGESSGQTGDATSGDSAGDSGSGDRSGSQSHGKSGHGGD